MREITQKIYTYDELSYKAKEKAKDDYRDTFREYQNNDFYEHFTEELKYQGFENLKPRYSLGYCQGDGCSVTGRIYIEEILNNEEILENFDKDEIRRLKYIDNSVEHKITIEIGSYHYCHANTMNFNALVWVNNYTHRRGELLEEVFEKLENVLEDYFKSLCYKMEEVGYKMIYDEEYLEEDIAQADFEFYEDGTRY